MCEDRGRLFEVPHGVTTRWSSPENWKGEKGRAAQANGGRKGSPYFPLKAGEQRVLADVSGSSGTISRIWVTIGNRIPKVLRGLRLDFYWDGESQPAVSAPFGDFFGMGLGRLAPFQSALFANPEGRSFNCCIPMPFRTGMKVVVTNESDVAEGSMFFDIDYTLGDPHGDDVTYFHAHYRRENPTTLGRDYELLPRVQGRGRFLGVNVGVIADQKRYGKSWWGEGEVKVYLDGDSDLPTLSGTGTEDFIGTAWGQGRYGHLYQGCPIADQENMQYAFYRYHIPDPVFFQKDVRVTIQQIGCWGPHTRPAIHFAGQPVYKAGPAREVLDLSAKGVPEPYGLFERQDDWSSCAYFYLDRAANDLPALDPVEKRVGGLLESAAAARRVDA